MLSFSTENSDGQHSATEPTPLTITRFFHKNQPDRRAKVHSVDDTMRIDARRAGVRYRDSIKSTNPGQHASQSKQATALHKHAGAAQVGASNFSEIEIAYLALSCDQRSDFTHATSPMLWPQCAALACHSRLQAARWRRIRRRAAPDCTPEPTSARRQANSHASRRRARKTGFCDAAARRHGAAALLRTTWRWGAG